MYWLFMYASKIYCKPQSKLSNLISKDRIEALDERKAMLTFNKYFKVFPALNSFSYQMKPVFACYKLAARMHSSKMHTVRCDGRHLGGDVSRGDVTEPSSVAAAAAVSSSQWLIDTCLCN